MSAQTIDLMRPVPKGGAHARRIFGDTVGHILLAVLSIIWLLPVVWVLMESFNTNQTQSISTFFPTHYTLSNYPGLWTNPNFPFVDQFLNTFIIAVFTCAISTVFVLAVSYSLSRLHFGFRKAYMNVALILGMFPGIAAVIVLYFVLKSYGLAGNVTAFLSLLGLILVYSAGSGAGFFIMKGYMDTIPKSLDEAAYLDGCSRWQVFTKIILPVCRPMLVYQALTSFLGPWLDFAMASVIVGSLGAKHYTVAVGLYSLVITQSTATRFFPQFAAGAVCISIPIAILYLFMQRFYTESMGGAVKG